MWRGGAIASRIRADPLHSLHQHRTMCHVRRAIYWTGIGRVVFGLSEAGLMKYTGSHEENPTLDLPCREVFARGQRKIAIAGPLLEDEAGKVHEGFWVPGN